MISQSEIQSDLESCAVLQFDNLVKKGELFWEETEETKVEQKPFDVYFRISPILLTKPYNPNTRSRRPGFLDDDPEFTLLPHVKPNHKLILNKYCWLRPQLILHTLDFQSQTDLLTEDDFSASCEVLKQFGQPYIVIFNGGPDAGSSVAHKHLQVFARPEWRTVADDFVEKLETGEVNEAGTQDIATKLHQFKPPAAKLTPTTIPLPFLNLIAPLKPTTTPSELYALYLTMCEQLSIFPSKTQSSSNSNQESRSTPAYPVDASKPVAHSLLLTTTWLMVIPRASATIHGPVPDAPMQGGANAMIGMLWLKSREQMQNWISFGRGGPMGVLREFGVQDLDYDVPDEKEEMKETNQGAEEGSE